MFLLIDSGCFVGPHFHNDTFNNVPAFQKFEATKFDVEGNVHEFWMNKNGVAIQGAL